MQRLDANADGVLATDELPAGMEANFKSADTNGDGLIDRGELTTAARNFARLAPPSAPGGEGAGGGE
jgi:hypothetical protein